MLTKSVLSTVWNIFLEYMFAFYFLLCYKINFDGGDLSSDAGLLLIKEFISKLGIDTLLEKAYQYQ